MDENVERERGRRKMLEVNEKGKDVIREDIMKICSDLVEAVVFVAIDTDDYEIVNFKKCVISVRKELEDYIWEIEGDLETWKELKRDLKDKVPLEEDCPILQEMKLQKEEWMKMLREKEEEERCLR